MFAGNDLRNAHHLYVLVLDAKKLGVSRDEVLKRMGRRGIGVHFRPVHLQPYYRCKNGFKQGVPPRAEYPGQGVISLPLYPSMKVGDVKRATQVLLAAVGAG